MHPGNPNNTVAYTAPSDVGTDKKALAWQVATTKTGNSNGTSQGFVVCAPTE